MSAKGAPHDGKDTVKTLRTIIWYKRACIMETTQLLSIAVQTSKKDVNKSVFYRTSSELENSVLEINHVTNVTTVLNETAVSGWGSCWGHHSDSVLRCLVFRETVPFELVSPRIQASPQTVKIIFIN